MADSSVQRPQHVAIIMDGNRRWARERLLPGLEGHRQGVKAVRRTIEACIELAIPTLTLYTFSSENWRRPAEEVAALMGLLTNHLRCEMEELVRQGVRFRALGRIQDLDPTIRHLVSVLEQHTCHNQRLHFNIALNYGGRQELVDAMQHLARDVGHGQLAWQQIDEQAIQSRLTTVGQSDPDLLIRTGGEQRVSNFLLWQIAYTELLFMPVYWPDFDRHHLRQAIEDFSRRERRFGAAC
ncbi:MAG: di-trans,poly-cis-decaprenylcistransferase [Magnetococcales bacterium]|nr:di-trans,poly-cis-decaprenylcistransferase [Magnetococcales bacterium]